MASLFVSLKIKLNSYTKKEQTFKIDYKHLTGAFLSPKIAYIKNE